MIRRKQKYNLYKTPYILLLLLFSSCFNNQNKAVIEFSEMEITNKKEMIHNILIQYEIENSDVYCLAQTRMGSREISRRTVSESFEGVGFIPEGPPGEEGQTPPRYKELVNDNSLYEKNSIVVNYADDSAISIHYDYLSFLIVIDEKYNEKIPRLEDALKNFILNKQRADVLTILIK